MKKLYVIGIGPGGKDRMTLESIKAIDEAEVLVGYTPYLEYVKDYTKNKEVFTSGMRAEVERCQKAIEFAKEGKTTAILSTGDAGLYGMAGPILELAKDEDIEVEIIPGVTSVFSAASELGAPVMHDLAIISLSDLMTPWELIQKRLDLAAQGDFVIAIYNPRSKGRSEHLKTAIDIILKHKDKNTPVGLVKNSGRDNMEKWITSLGEIDYEKVDMLTILIIGNKTTFVDKEKIITPRGYQI